MPAQAFPADILSRALLFYLKQYRHPLPGILKPVFGKFFTAADPVIFAAIYNKAKRVFLFL